MILTVANQKGGSAKTTTSINLGAASALSGKKTLLVDLDPQGNTSKTFAVSEDLPTVYDLLSNELSIKDTASKTELENLYIIRSDIYLSSFERSEAANPNVAYMLREKLWPEAGKWDLIVIDTGPTLSGLTVNALTASEYILVPIQASYYCLQGTEDLMKTYNLVKKNINPGLEILGVLVTMYQRTVISREARLEVIRVFGSKVFETVIHRGVVLEESPAQGQSVLTYAPKSRGCIEYQALYREVMSRV